MSALQASRMYKVPSRTLYDKVKKMGIVGTRPMNRAVKRSPSNNGSPASFPYGISGTRGSPIGHHLEGGQSHSHSLAGDGENGDEMEQRERGRDLPWPMMDPNILFKAIGSTDIASRAAAALAAANGFKSAGRQSSQSPPAPPPGIYQGSTSVAPMSPQRSIHEDDDDDDEEPRYKKNI